MTAPTARPLDSFETALLTELRTVVAERRPAPAPPRRPWNRRWLLAPVGIAAAATTALLVVPGTGPQPAYAVTQDSGGDVHVTVDRLEDASGLAKALEEHGIAADVTYLDDNMVCADGRYRDAPPNDGDVRFSMGGNGYGVDLTAGAVREGETVVISASRLTDLPPGQSDGITGSVGIATGPVAPCEPVPAPPLPPASGSDDGPGTRSGTGGEGPTTEQG